MKAKVNSPKSDLERAIRALRTDEPSLRATAESRTRLESRLFSESCVVAETGPIRGCEAVQSLLAAYRRDGLTTTRALLVRNHLTECQDCREVYARRGSLRLATTPWQRVARLELAPRFVSRRAWAAMAAAVVVCVALMALRSVFFGVPAGQRAIVQAVSGALYRVDGSIAERLTAGALLNEGQVVRAGPSPQSLLRLVDGSVVELGERAEFSIAVRGRDTTLHLKRGQIIVQAAKRNSGHLYVAAPDCRVAVTGTVFSVLASLKGSRVSVIEGEVRVAQPLGHERVLHRGDQVTTSPGLGRIPISREIAWSRNLDEHLALLNELTNLKKDWDAVHSPDLRYESRLIDKVPDRTVVYAALPNYGETLNEGYRLFKARLNESAVLEKWWKQSELGQQGANLDSLIAKMHDLSAFLGDEVVIAGSLVGDTPQLVVMAEVKRAGLRDRLGTELTLPNGETIPITVVDEEGAASLADHGTDLDSATLLVTPQLAALSPSRTAIAEVASRLSSDRRGAFATSRIGERVTDAYLRGVGVLIAADLEMLTASSVNARRNGAYERSPDSVLFERRVVLGQTLNSGELAFDGPRDGLASWLAEPAAMGSLDFLTPQASAVVAFLVKRPTEVLDDILRLAPSGSDVLSKLAQFEAAWNLRVRDDLADALGAEVAIALDGPLLPQPAWKLVIEVEDADRLERGLEALMRRADQEMRKTGAGAIVFEHEQVGTHTFHRITTRDVAVPFEADYAFVNGYLVMTPSRALLSRAIEANSHGETLARSSRFTALLPRDEKASVSGIVFQDLLGVVATALGTAEIALAPEQVQQLEKLRSEAKPTLVGFYGREERIEMAGVGDLLPIGPAALALPGLIRHTFPGTFSAPLK